MLMSERYWVLNDNDMTIPGNISFEMSMTVKGF